MLSIMKERFPCWNPMNKKKETTKTRFAWRRAGFSLISVDFMGNRAFILYDIHVIIKFSLFFEHGGESAVA